MNKPNFSIVLIARNEEKTLPRLLSSLEEFKKRDGEIVLLDTGSTDCTAKLARDHGCKVEEVGDKFKRVVTEEEAFRINTDLAEGESNIIEPGDSLFDYASARNYAATLASNDMIATPDCDEMYTKFDLDFVCDAIASGVEQLEYNFVFSHDGQGNDLIKFMHSKFYNRTKLKWEGVIHEVLVGEAKRKFFDEAVIKLEHWQNHETNRGHYIKGLALSVLDNPDNDRNLHYYARDLMYAGKFKSAIKMFEKHVAMGKWPAERSQSLLHIGECYMSIGETRKAIHNWIDSFDASSDRREPLMKIAEYYNNVGSTDHVISYVAAALQIKEGNFYANYQPYYENIPHELMYKALWKKSEYLASKQHFDICFAYQPFNSEYLHDFRNYFELPKISIVAPIKGRPDGVKKLIESIKNLNYPQDKIETVLLYDGEKPTSEYEKDENIKVIYRDTSQGVPLAVKQGVKESTGDWIIYAANDMEFTPDSIMCAFKTAMDNSMFFMAFNTGPVLEDEGNICEHFMIKRKMITKIDGEIFDTEFNHVGVDNLLWAKMKRLGHAMRCERAVVKHNHFSKIGGAMDEVYKKGWNEENVKKDRELLQKKLSALNNQK